MNKKARARFAVVRKSVVMLGVFSAFLVCATVVVIVWGQRNFGTSLLGARIAFLAVLSVCAFALVLYALLSMRKKPNKAPEPTSGTVTPPAEPGVAPVPPVAHL